MDEQVRRITGGGVGRYGAWNSERTAANMEYDKCYKVMNVDYSKQQQNCIEVLFVFKSRMAIHPRYIQLDA